MFGPSEVWVEGVHTSVQCHHRCAEFTDFMRRLEARFKSRTGLAKDWIILFIPGSGTLANEIVLASCNRPRLLPGPAGCTFGDRLTALACLYGKWAGDWSPDMPEFSVQYDTARAYLSHYGDTSCCPLFIDAVSAFPYYSLPKACDVFTTVAGKQLGCGPGLSIIGIRPRAVQYFHAATTSTLSLRSYLDARERGCTPHTPAAGLMAHLAQVLDGFDLARFRTRIDNRRRWVVAACEPSWIIGEGPVVTFKPGVLPAKFVANWRLYTGACGPQVFLWYGEDRDYKELCAELRKLKGKSVE